MLDSPGTLGWFPVPSPTESTVTEPCMQQTSQSCMQQTTTPKVKVDILIFISKGKLLCWHVLCHGFCKDCSSKDFSNQYEQMKVFDGK